jgi:hypothetical protein
MLQWERRPAQQPPGGPLTNNRCSAVLSHKTGHNLGAACRVPVDEQDHAPVKALPTKALRHYDDGFVHKLEPQREPNEGEFA